MACVAKNPSARPQTIVALSDLLDACENVEPWTKPEAREWWVKHAARIAALRPPDPPDALDSKHLGSIPRLDTPMDVTRSTVPE